MPRGKLVLMARRGARGGMGGGAVRTVGCDEAGMREAQRQVAAGGLVAFPTDTVYGIGCDPFNENAVGLVYAAKGRPASKPLPVLGASTSALSGLACLGGRAAGLAARFWPGPLTIVAEATGPPASGNGRRLAPQLVSGGGRVAVRVPAGRCVQSLLSACGPLVGTSANLSGRTPCRTAAECAERLGGRVPLVVDGGPSPGGAASTVAEADGDRVRIIREGPVPGGELERTA